MIYRFCENTMCARTDPATAEKIALAIGARFVMTVGDYDCVLFSDDDLPTVQAIVDGKG
jgi:hypothetical protein